MNETSIRKHYRLLEHKKETEIRVFGKKHPKGKSLFVSNQDAFLKTVIESNEDGCVFVGYNERLGGGKKDKDVISCRIIPIDLDSTNDEDCKKVEVKLKEMGIKYSHKLETGGGIHYYIPIPEQKGDKIQGILDKAKQVLPKLNKNIDTKVYNPSRILRVWGTHNKKEGRGNKEVKIVEENTLNKSEIENNYWTILDCHEELEQESTGSTPPSKKIRFACPLIKYVHEHTIEKTGVEKNDVLFKNVAIYMFQKFGNTPESRKILGEIAKRQKHSPSEIISWFEKAKSGALSDFNLEELKKWNKKHELGLEKYIAWGALRERVLMYLASKQKNEATEELVRQFLEIEHIFTTRDDEKSEMWIYDNGIYIPQGKTFIREYCRTQTMEAYSTHLCNQVIAKIEAETFIEQTDFFINEDVNKIAVQNGILNLKTKTLEKFSPDYRFFNKLPVKFVPNQDCPAVKQFLKEVLKGDDITVIQEIFGYVLYREYRIEKAFMFSGNGRNGKSKTLDLMKRFIGAENCTNISLQSFEKNNFAVGELFNKMANLAGDISSTGLKETGNFKSLTGQDLISAPRKFLTNVDFVNYAKMLFSANELPITYDVSVAFFNRWVLIDFPYTFLSKDEIDRLPEKEKKDVKVADRGIINKISTQEELDGLLNWALEGLHRLLEQEDFSNSTTTQEVKIAWLRKSSSINAFIMDCVVEDYDDYITKSDFRQKYSDYCRKHKIKPATDEAIKFCLTTQVGASEEQKSVDDGRQRCWVGIKLKEIILEPSGHNYTPHTNNTGGLYLYEESKILHREKSHVLPVKGVFEKKEDGEKPAEPLIEFGIPDNEFD